MGLFWVGFVIGFLVALLVLLVALALWDELVESDAQRVAREVREAKRQIDRLFGETRSKMAATTERETQPERAAGGELGALREAWRKTK